MNILEFFNAEVLWPYVTGEKDIPRDNVNNIPYYRSARDFGRLCAITSLQKATSDPSHRPIDYEFVDVYNGITKALLATLEMKQDGSVSMTNLRILAGYIGSTFTDQQSFERALDVVLKGDISEVYVPDVHIVDEDRRKRVIGTFGGCLKAFNNFYGTSETKKITKVNGQEEIGLERKL